MSISDSNIKKESSVNCICFGKYKSKHNKNKCARPVTNIAICSYIVESDSSDEDIPKERDVKGMVGKSMSKEEKHVVKPDTIGEDVKKTDEKTKNKEEKDEEKTDPKRKDGKGTDNNTKSKEENDVEKPDTICKDVKKTDEKTQNEEKDVELQDTKGKDVKSKVEETMNNKVKDADKPNPKGQNNSWSEYEETIWYSCGE